MHDWPSNEHPCHYTYKLDLVDHDPKTLLNIVNELMKREDAQLVGVQHDLIYFAQYDGPNDIYQTLGYDKEAVNITIEGPPITNN